MATLAVRSEVEAVTVYRRGARVRRRARLARGDGGYPASIALAGLPLSVHDDSVKVSVIGAGAAPTARDIRVTLDVPPRDETLAPATPEELERARLDEERCAARLAQLRRELERVRGIELIARPPGAEGEAPPPSPTDARLSLIEFREREARELAAEAEAEERAHEDAVRHRLELEARNRRATSARQAEEHELRKAVVVSLSGRDGDAAEVEIELEYQVPGARWAPAYALHLDRAMTRASLAMRAVVAQHSGEDWSGVALTLSTAEMQRATELPELASVRIGRAQPAPRPGWRPPPTGADELYTDWDRAFRAELFESTPPAPKRRAAAPAPPPQPEPMAAEEVDFEMAPSTVMLGAAREEAADDAPVYPAAPPQSLMTRSAPRKGGLLGGLFSGGGGAPPAPPAMAAPAPAGMARKRAAAPAEAALIADAPAETEVGADLLAYGDLRMPAPTDRRRGRLVVATRQEIYVQLLVAQEVAVAVDVVGAVDRAANRAERIADERLPRGCVLAWSEHYDYAYAARARVDVPSDGNYHTVPLAEAAADARRLYVVVPRASTDVFRTVRLDNPLASPLLAGPIDVYLGGDFLVTGQVEFTASRGEMTLGLGVEQGIKVARNTHYREETAGLIGGALELHHQIRVEVKNNLEQAAPIEVRERIPAARDDDEDEIKISIESVSPAWRPYEQPVAGPGEAELEGGYVWRLEVAPGATENLRADYQVRISSKHELVGGNRREV